MITVLISGLKTEPINIRGHWRTKAKKTAAVRNIVKLKVMVSRARGKGLPSSVRVTRLSAGTLDHGAVYEAIKSVVDGLADGLGLTDDRELQEPSRMSVAQEKCKRGTCGIRIEMDFA